MGEVDGRQGRREGRGKGDIGDEGEGEGEGMDGRCG